MRTPRQQARKRHLIIPVFIPFGGCPNKCAFCDQNNITGDTELPSAGSVKETIKNYLSTWKFSGLKEVAFYGGSFTGLLEAQQLEYLEAVREFLEKGQIDSIRLSTRPDYISGHILDYLKAYGVETVELGVQSMSDEVLRLSGRGHTSGHTITAVALLKERGFKIGLQFMPGLPGDTIETIIHTTKCVAQMRPDFARVYPTLVLKDTPLHKMFMEGKYTPWPLDEMVNVCREVSKILKEAGVAVIRMGLHPSEELRQSLVAGPYHPSFRQLVEG